MKKEKNSKKYIILYLIVIAIFTIGIVPKQFQNDTFFYISIGKYILNNGIDMQEHFSWVSGLTYTYSHWAFDILIYFIYNLFNFTGIYIFVIIFAIIINITLFCCLTKLYKYPVISLILTLFFSYTICDSFTARSQIISFLGFIVEIYCLEHFIDTNKKRYPITLIILSIIIANFHAATWPLILVLFMPYIVAALFNIFTAQNIYLFCANMLKRKLKKLDPSTEKAQTCQKDIDDYLRLSQNAIPFKDSKLKFRNNYNLKNILILFFIISFTGLITPIHNVPYTYIINSLLGKSNLDNASSIDYINEMQPITPASNLAFMCFSIVAIIIISSTHTKLNLEHVFLLSGLYIMTLSSCRYVYLLVFLGSFIICNLYSQCVNIEKGKILLKTSVNVTICSVALIVSCVFSVYNLIKKSDVSYVNEALYPIGATEYIKNNLDYKNMRIYNHYNNGSYLMLNGIPVFIDSRLDVYCSEFNDTNVFRDFIYVSDGIESYKKVFSEYDFTHILLYKDEVAAKYIVDDPDYNLLYEDDYFVLYEKLN